MKRTSLLVMAVTLHNIPEGMAVGLARSRSQRSTAQATPIAFASAIALAIGIGIQNFPEGAAISLPLRQEAHERRQVVCQRHAQLASSSRSLASSRVLVSAFIAPYMPWMLAFAAGAMMYVVVEELIPEAHLGEHSNVGTLGVMGGFLVMMILDVALG